MGGIIISFFNEESPSARIITRKTLNKLRNPAAFIGIGLAIGAGAGVAMGNIAIGVGMGLAIGAALAAATWKKLASQPEDAEHNTRDE